MNKLILAALPLLANGLLAQGTPEVEPNATAATATPISPGAQGDGAIGLAGDTDYWKITLASAADLRCWINPGIGTALANSDLTLIASDGTTEIEFNDDATAPASWLSAIVSGGLAPGDYYLRVRSSVNFDPNGTGTYTLDVVSAQLGTYVAVGGGPGIPTPVQEGPESNDPRQPGGVATSS
ncbi:MAG: PPC domain-containing protein, partial [Planctomycetes bacterium]|nr:PPC domain-containing protein [Planctomycetota bacterium]